MSAARIECGGSSSVVVGATSYFPLMIARIVTQSTETTVQSAWRTAGLATKLYCRVNSNSDTASSTMRFRKNTADGNMSLSIGAAATGEFEDNAATDSIAAGDLVDGKIVDGGGGTLTLSNVRVVFLTPGQTCAKYGGGFSGFSLTSTNTTHFLILCSEFNPGTTEANHQVKMKVAGTFKNFQIKVSANARTTTTVSGIRINGVAGTLTFSVLAGQTGLFEDTTDSDAVIAGDLVNYYVTTGSDANSITVDFCSVEFLATYVEQFVVGANAGLAVGSGVTTNFFVCGRLNAQATELVTRLNAGAAGLWQNLQAYVSANTVNNTSTINNRINGTNGAMSLSIGASATGFFHDDANSNPVSGTDELNYQIVNGTGGTLTLRSMSSLFKEVSGPDKWCFCPPCVMEKNEIVSY